MSIEYNFYFDDTRYNEIVKNIKENTKKTKNVFGYENSNFQIIKFGKYSNKFDKFTKSIHKKCNINKLTSYTKFFILFCYHYMTNKNVNLIYIYYNYNYNYKLQTNYIDVIKLLFIFYTIYSKNNVNDLSIFDKINPKIYTK
jgi:hypothetical protein